MRSSFMLALYHGGLYSTREAELDHHIMLAIKDGTKIQQKKSTGSNSDHRHPVWPMDLWLCQDTTP